MFKFTKNMAIIFSFGLLVSGILVKGKIMSQAFLNPAASPQNTYQSKPQNNKNKEVRTSIFYMNDLHGKLTNIRHMKTAADSFTRTHTGRTDVDSFKLGGGDFNIGKPEAKNKFVINFLNSIGLDLTAIGNHEFDIGQQGFAKEIDGAKYKYVSSNINIDPKCDLTQDFKDKKIVKSWVMEKNGNKYGFVGGTPIDLKLRLAKTSDVSGIAVDPTDKTIKDIQTEVNNLKKQGIDKIILLSHLGKDKEQIVAQSVSGIDVIVGGHTHDLIKGITPGDNWFKSPSGEPVLITQAGKDGAHFGVLDLVFDDQGRIKAASNNVFDTADYPKDPFIRVVEDGYLGKTKQIGQLVKDCKPTKTSLTENPLASYMADATKDKAGAQIAFVNSENIRGGLDAGVVTERDVQELEPFKNKVYKLEITEKTVIDTLNDAAKSVLTPECKPGVLQVGGLKYTITPQHTVKDVYMVNSDGTQVKLDDKKPSTSKTFTVVYDEFLLKGDEFPTLKNPVKILNKYEWNKADAMSERISKEAGKPLDIKSDGRIKIEK